MLLGHWQEMKALGQARGALSALAALLPDKAERITPTGVETVERASLAVGDTVLVRPGERVPADGVVVGEPAELDHGGSDRGRGHHRGGVADGDAAAGDDPTGARS